MRVLEGANRSGHGLVNVISYNGETTPDVEALFLDYEEMHTTIGMLLSDEDVLNANKYAQVYLDEALRHLPLEIPLSEDDVMRIPILWKDVTYPFSH